MSTKKHFYCLLLRKSIAFALLLCGSSTHAQISNSNIPHPSAALDLSATNQGLLLPRVALTGTADVTTIPAPATSLMVYNTNAIAGMPVGFYSWSGSRWEILSNEAVTHALASSANTMTNTVNGVAKTADIINTNALALTGTNLTSTINGKASTALNLAAITGWGLNGNAIGATTSFIGTTDNQPLRFRTSTTEKMTLSPNGNFGIATTTPEYALDVRPASPILARFLHNNGTQGMTFGFDNITKVGSNVPASNHLTITTQAVGGNLNLIAGTNMNATAAGSLILKGNEVQLTSTANQPLYFSTNTTERMRLDGNGRLALGTATPTTARLTVNGLPSVGILASFRDGNNKAGFDIDWTALNRIDTDNTNSNFTINAQGTGAVVLNKAMVSNLPAGAPTDPFVSADASGNLRKVTATNANRIQGIPVAANPPSAGNLLRYDGTQWVAAQLSTYYYTALKSNAGTAIGSSTTAYTPIEMNNKIYDPFAAVSADGKTVTLQSGHAGTYAIKYAVNMYTLHAHTPTRFRCQVTRNGSAVETTTKTTVGSSGINETLNGTFVIALAANDYIRVELNLGGSSTAFNPATITSFIMEKIN